MEPKDEVTPQKADKRGKKKVSLETRFEGLDTALA